MTDAAAWTAACRRMVAGVRVELDRLPSRAARSVVVGQGEGGDETTEIDRVAEAVVVRELEALAATGLAFTLVSEELGVRRFGTGSTVHVVVDPIDGSLNAKRRLPFYALSIAVAAGPTMGEVWLGYVADLVSGEEWLAESGTGASLDGRPLGAERPGEQLELVGLEATRPRLLVAAAAALPADVRRVRVLGSLALALCQVAAGRLDAVASLRTAGARAVDIAAAQLIVREAGFVVDLPDVDEPFGSAPLDLQGRSRVIAALDEERLQVLRDMLLAASAGTLPA